jgi:hypothetical protein
MRKVSRALFLIMLPLLSCSLSQFSGKSGAEKNKAGAGSYDENFDPLSLNDDAFKVTPPDQAGDRQAVAQRVTVPKTERSEGGEATVQGYRVQLAATTDENRARDLKKEAMLKLKEKIYLIFESPNYKVRVGDCKSFDEAKLLKQEVQNSGFPEAWIVKSTVYATAASGD